MGVKEKGSFLHWNYFLALESDLENVSRYIEFSNKNFKTYSIELAHLLLAASSEVDVIAKEICKLLEPSEKAGNINEYREIILKHYPDFPNEEVFVSRYGLSFKPWINWGERKIPNWWKSYNKVKHHRNDHFSDANLQNVLNSLGGLLIMAFYFYKIKFSLDNPDAFRRNGDVIRELRPTSDFMRLSEDYYPGIRSTSSKS